MNPAINGILAQCYQLVPLPSTDDSAWWENPGQALPCVL